MNTAASVEELRSRGNELFKLSNFVGAADKYSEALELISKSRFTVNTEVTALLFQNRAACYLKMQRFTDCVSDCDSALQINPSSTKALYRRACAFEKLNQINDSKRDALFILQLEPSNKDAAALMRRLNQTSSNIPAQGLDRLLSDVMTKDDPEALLTCIETIRAYCENDEEKYYAFVKASGLQVINKVICEIGFDTTSDTTIKLYHSTLRLLLGICQFQSIVSKFVNFDDLHGTEANLKGVLDIGGKLSFSRLITYGVLWENFELRYRILLLIMAILKFMNLLKLEYRDIDPDKLNEEHLQLTKESIMAASHLFAIALKSASEPKSFQFICDSIGSFVSNVPDYYSHDQFCNVDPKLETMDQRKIRLRTTAAANIRSKLHAICIIECNVVNILISNLHIPESVVRSNASVCLGKIFKFVDDENISQSILKPYFDHVDERDNLMVKVRCNILHCLLSTQPTLGAWALVECGGVDQLKILIASSDSSQISLASEIVCLAAGNEKASGCLQPLIAAGVLNSFITNPDIAVQAAGAAALAKLAIKAKALTQDSLENSVILNSATHVIKRSQPKNIKEPSIERAIEILASMISKSYVKQELVFGSSRVSPILTELCSIEVDERSTASYGLAFIFANLTVTNWELRALALADKDISVEQYEKMMELQRIKAKDENGELLEEKKEEDDVDTMEQCKVRIRKLVHSGGLKIIMKLAEFHSEQTSLAASRTLRQVCVDEQSRGLFIQQGCLKFCLDVASNESKLIAIRKETSHAVAKSLITTNPHLLSDSIRLSSIRPLLYLCEASDSNDLQRFEALLALTNIISCGQHEQDKFVHERGISIVHYLVFHDNLSIRQASVETLCNISSHDSMRKILYQDNNIKLWLGLIEEWLDDGESDVAFRTAKAAAGTLAMTSGDLGVALALSRNESVSTFTRVLRSNNHDMVHRVLVTIIEMLSLTDQNIIAHLKQNEIVFALCELDVDEENRELVSEIGRLLRS